MCRLFGSYMWSEEERPEYDHVEEYVDKHWASGYYRALPGPRGWVKQDYLFPPSLPPLSGHQDPDQKA
eukprot:3499356-Rhodomonas_salina.1